MKTNTILLAVAALFGAATLAQASPADGTISLKPSVKKEQVGKHHHRKHHRKHHRHHHHK